MPENRFDRNVKLFGQAGQDAIRQARVAVVGLGGIGSHIVQGLTYLGVRRFVLFDDDTVSSSSLNRLIGATPEDARLGTSKLEVAERLIKGVEVDAKIDRVPERAVSEAFLALAESADILFGCVDRETPRLQLTAYAADRAKPYVDCSTDVDAEGGGLRYGGRIQVFTGDGCLSCLAELDQELLRLETLSPEQLGADEAIYGVPRDHLSEGGPSVVSLNGVVAHAALTEAMCFLTGLRAVNRLLVYHAHFGGVSIPQRAPSPDCYYCRRWQARAAAKS
jgi:molybdopterin-synthase adenylyltransferase